MKSKQPNLDLPVERTELGRRAERYLQLKGEISDLKDQLREAEGDVLGEMRRQKKMAVKLGGCSLVMQKVPGLERLRVEK